MIKSKKDYKYYLEYDKLALGRTGKRPAINNYIWKFQRLMRRRKYYTNCKGEFYSIQKIYLWHRYNKLSLQLGFEIPINSICPGAKLYGDIISGNNVAIGTNSIVNKSFNNNITIVGVLAKIINYNGSIGKLIIAAK